MLRLTREQLRDESLYPLLLDGILSLTPKRLRPLLPHLTGVLRFSDGAMRERHLLAWSYLCQFTDWQKRRREMRRRHLFSASVVLVSTLMIPVTYGNFGWSAPTLFQIGATLLPFIELPRLLRDYDKHVMHFPRYAVHQTSQTDVFALLDRLDLAETHSTINEVKHDVQTQTSTE